MPETSTKSRDLQISFTGLVGMRFRLRRAEFVMIHAGLKPCVCAYVQGKTFGRYPYADFFRTYPHLRPAEGKFNQMLMDKVSTLFALTAQWVADLRGKTHRIQLDPIGIAALAFFARAAATQIRHGHITVPVPKPQRQTARLTRKLEVLRQRALRAAKRRGQLDLYSGAAKEWRNFQTWMRGHLLYCRCHRPSIFSARHRHRMFIAECERLITEVIAEQQLQMPDPARLHYLARHVLRYARRGRLAVGIPGLLKGNDRSRYVLARFLETRLPHQSTCNSERRAYENDTRVGPR